METLDPPWGRWSIEREEVSQDIVVLKPSTTISEALDALELAVAPNFAYLIMPHDVQHFLVLRGNDLFTRLVDQEDDRLHMSLEQFLADIVPVAAVERGSQGKQSILTLRGQQPGERLVYVQGSDVLGVLAKDFRSGFLNPITKPPCYRCRSEPAHVFSFGERLPRDANGLRRCPHDDAVLDRTNKC